MTEISFEFFPPRNDKMAAAFWRALEGLQAFRPHFISLTYGAGGSTAARSLELLEALQAGEHPAVAAHLTCVGASRAQTDAVIASYQAIGITHFVALRGDMPNMEAYEAHPQGYSGSVELVASLREKGAAEISVSAYPEPHPEANSKAQDMDILIQKADAGAQRAITQFCFDTDAILRLRDEVAKRAPSLQFVPGIMPTTNFAGVERMAKACGATLPASLRERYTDIQNDKPRCQKMAVAVAAEQCAALQAEGVAELHFYTLNQSLVVDEICKQCGLGAAQ